MLMNQKVNDYNESVLLFSYFSFMLLQPLLSHCQLLHLVLCP